MWSASRPVALWHFLVLHYCVGHDSRAFGDHWVSGGLKLGAMRAPLHVLVVLLCSAYRAFSCSLLFQGFPPLSRPFILYFLYSLLYRFSTVLPVQCDGCQGRDWVFSGGWDGWVASRAGSWVFWLLGLGSTENSWLESTFDLGSGYQVTKYLPLKKLFTGLKIIHLYL